MANPVIHFEVHVKDGKKSQNFYKNLFDWHIDANNPIDYGVVDTHSKGINGGVTVSPTAPMVTFYVSVDDLQAYLDKAESIGGKTVTPPTEIPGVVTYALFADPDGNVIGLFKEDE